MRHRIRHGRRHHHHHGFGGHHRPWGEGGEAEFCNRPPSRSLFWRVYLHGAFLLVVVAVTILGLGLAFRGRVPWSQFPQHFARHLTQRYDEEHGDPATLTAELRRERDLLTVEASLYRIDGTLIATNIDPPLSPLGPDRLARLSHGPVELNNFGWGQAVALEHEGRPFAYVAVRWPHSNDFPLVRGAVILGGVLLALALASIPLARAIVSPLERLTSTARAFGQGDLSARTGMDYPGEVGLLASAFDEMATRIELLIRGEKELLANVSHELRTPLARIRFALELAAEGNLEEARHYLAEIGTDLGELERVVEDVLLTAKLDLAQGRAGDGTFPLRRVLIESGELITCAEERFRTAFPERKLVLEVQTGLPTVDGDPVFLRRVVDNLLENAHKYADPEAPITLAARAEEGRLVVEVRDRGQGISEEDLPHLFTPFFRTDRSRARGTGGVGLGLALARRVVEAHGGQIAAESEVGVGTVFRFYVPGVA